MRVRTLEGLLVASCLAVGAAIALTSASWSTDDRELAMRRANVDIAHLEFAVEDLKKRVKVLEDKQGIAK